MIKKIAPLILLFIYYNSFGQTNINEVDKVKSLIQVWGLFKYQHPEISKGKFNFDQELIYKFEEISTIHTQEDLNQALANWINKFETPKTRYSSNSKLLINPKMFNKNVDFSWVENSNFSTELIQVLNKVKNNGTIGNHYAKVSALTKMVSFPNDIGFENFDANQKSNRILFLASFWSKMNYWNANIYLTDTPWSLVLEEMIPEFLSTETTRYEMAKDMLIAKLNDSHANYNASFLFRDKSLKKAIYGGRIVNDTLVIKSLFNKNLADEEGIEIGDLICQINGKSIESYINEKFKNRISASNQNYLKAVLEGYYLLSDMADILNVDVLKKDGTKLNKNIRLYHHDQYKFEFEKMKKDTLGQWTFLRNDVGYINLEGISKKELKSAFKAFENTKGLILDLRNYPRNLRVSDVPNFILPKRKIFVKMLAPYSPSYAKYDIKATLRMINNPFAAGKNNRNYYKGKVILLVDRTTGSMAEYFAMAIQQAPNIITAGEQTFGAVMNRNEVLLPDNTTVDFTGMGAFYPNDVEVQRKGLKIDFEIKESAIYYNQSKYIEEALKLMEN